MRKILDTLPLSKALRTLLVIDRSSFQLNLYKRPMLSTRFKRVRSIEIAIGAIGYATPSGVFVITRKSDNPEWRAPDSEWVPEEIRGKVFSADDPANPIKGAFLDIYGGVGLHGTDNLASLGTQASHGCLRTSIKDAEWLYKNVPVGTPVVVI